jgi:hypothetical protein
MIKAINNAGTGKETGKEKINFNSKNTKNFFDAVEKSADKFKNKLVELTKAQTEYNFLYEKLAGNKDKNI